MKRLLLAFSLLLVSLPASAQDDWTPAPHRTGAHFSIGRDYTLPRGDTATGAVVVIGGTATIDGHVEEDVVVIGGTLRLGPTAEVDGDTTAIAGHVAMDPMARVHGEMNNVGVEWPQLGWAWPRWDWGSGIGQFAAFAWTGMRLLLTLVFSLLLTLMFPRSIADVSARIESSAGASFLVGLLVQVLFVPALVVLVVALVITIVGIPLLAAVPVLLAVFAGLWVAGFTAASATIGASLRGAVMPHIDPRIADVLIGFLVLTGCTIVGEVLQVGGGRFAALGAPVRFVGGAVEYLAWTVGLGAALTALVGRRHRDLPPPLPTAATSPHAM